MRGKKKNKNDNKDAKDLFADNAFKAQPSGKSYGQIDFDVELEF